MHSVVPAQMLIFLGTEYETSDRTKEIVCALRLKILVRYLAYSILQFRLQRIVLRSALSLACLAFTMCVYSGSVDENKPVLINACLSQALHLRNIPEQICRIASTQSSRSA